MYKKILITGSNGFIAKNLYVNLIKKHPDIEVLKFSRENNLKELQDMVKDADLIYHLAGENRPKDKDSFYKVNQLLTNKICEILSDSKTKMFLLSFHQLLKLQKIMIMENQN